MGLGNPECEYNLLIPLQFDLSLDRLELFLNRVFTSIIGQFSSYSIEIIWVCSSCQGAKPGNI